MTLSVGKKLNVGPAVQLILRPTDHVTWYCFVRGKAKTDLPRKARGFKGIHA
jgi:hypothetical protein